MGVSVLKRFFQSATSFLPHHKFISCLYNNSSYSTTDNGLALTVVRESGSIVLTVEYRIISLLKTIFVY